MMSTASIAKKTGHSHPLASVLRGEMIRKLMAQLPQQDDTLAYNEILKVAGSTVPFLMGKDDSVKVPGDIDFAVQTDDGLRPNKGWPIEKTKMLLDRSAKACRTASTKEDNYRFENVPNHASSEPFAYIHHHFSQQEIQDIVQQRGMGKLVADNGIDLGDMQNGLQVTLPMQFVENPIHILPPKPFGEYPGKAGKLKPMLRDDLLDMFSLKLARIMIGEKDKPMQASDMLVVERMLKNPELRAEVLRDMDLLRILVVTRMGERIEVKAEDKDDLDKDQANLRARHNIRFAFKDDEDLAAFAAALQEKAYLVPDKIDIAETMHAVNTMIGKVFPEQEQSIGMPLTKGEKQFLKKVVAPDPHKASYDNIDMDLLVEGKTFRDGINPFERYAQLVPLPGGKSIGLKDKIHESNPLNDTITGHGACREYH